MKQFLLAFLITSGLVLAPVFGGIKAQEQAPYGGQDQGYQGPQGYPAPGQQGYPGGQEPGYAGSPDQGPPQQGQDQGQPQQGVGRVSVVEGNLSTQRGDSGDWVADTINTPVAVGDALSTGEGSQAEIQLDYANVLRLGPTSQARVADLEQGHIQVQVAQGLVDYVVLPRNETQAEIDTQNAGIQPTRDGVYRIEAISPAETRLTIRHGEAQVLEQQGSTTVHDGETITIRGTDNPEYQITQASPLDGWDHWNEERDRAILQAKSWQHTDPYYTGTQDLDQYGQWQNAPDYGQVWVPNQGPDWAPYSEGDWDWEPDWGWTWVSSEPWGWAPYHYGRWFMWNNAWAWWPGPIGLGLGWYRPIWAPAYVNFFGFGGFGLGIGFGWGLGYGWGHVGWLPVGPCDRFYPWWGGRGVNVVNIRNVNNIRNFNGVRGGMAPLGGGNRPLGSNLEGAFNNARIRNSISTMAGDRFGQGGVQPVRGGVTSDMLRNSSFMAGKLGVMPTKASLSATNRAPAAGTMRNAFAGSHFAGTRAPAFNRQSFTQAQANVRQITQNLSRSSIEQQGRANAAAVNRGGNIGGVESARFGTAGSASRSFGTPNRAPVTQTRPEQSSWQRFASPNTSRAGSTPSPAGRFSSPGATPSRSYQPFNGGARTEAAPSATRPGWSRFSTPSTTARPSFRSRSAPGYYRGNTSTRPPLEMNRPMFSPRSAPSTPSRSYGGYSAPPSRSYGGYSAPSRSYGGGRSSGGSSGGHSSGFGGGSHSSGGGHSGGGGSHGGGGGGHHR